MYERRKREGGTRKLIAITNHFVIQSSHGRSASYRQPSLQQEPSPPPERMSSSVIRRLHGWRSSHGKSTPPLTATIQAYLQQQRRSTGTDSHPHEQDPSPLQRTSHGESSSPSEGTVLPSPYGYLSTSTPVTYIARNTDDLHRETLQPRYGDVVPGKTYQDSSTTQG